jgi:transcriptional regulator with XRE-family HTH domain
VKRLRLRSATTYPAIVGAVLVAIRERAGVKQADVAAQVGLAASTWSRVEAGTSGLSVEQVARAADALHVLPSAILDVADRVRLAAERSYDVRVEVAPCKPRDALERRLALLGPASLGLLVRGELATARVTKWRRARRR